MTLGFKTIGFGPNNTVSYQDALLLQRKTHSNVRAKRDPSTTLLLEHDPVYTVGKRAEKHEYPALIAAGHDEKNLHAADGTPVILTDRGGKITWHGPGQLIGYPIIKLTEPINVTGYVRLLEKIIMATLGPYLPNLQQITGRSGVWLPATEDRPARKIAAIGVKVASRITMHGFAINCTNSLAPFTKIIPCGITDAAVTTLQQETGTDITPQELAPQIIKNTTTFFEGNPQIIEQ